MPKSKNYTASLPLMKKDSLHQSCLWVQAFGREPIKIVFVLRDIISHINL